jgi:hypothetical protein
MPKITLLLCLLFSVVFVSCKKDEVADTTPQLAAKIAGTYKLSKLLRSPSLVDVTSTATGTAIVTAKDASTASINYKLTIGTNTQEITTDFKVTQNGTDYTITDSSNNTGVVQGNTLKMTIPFITLSSSTNYIIEFTK